MQERVERGTKKEYSAYSSAIGPSDCQRAAKELGVTIAIGVLAERVGDLDKRVSDLAERLRLVLPLDYWKSAAPGPDSSTLESKPGGSPLSVDLAQYNARLGFIVERLIELCVNLDI